MRDDVNRPFPKADAASQTRSNEFAAGLLVLTLSGALPVEYLLPGDRVITRSGARTVTAVESRIVPVARMIRVSESTLGIDQPQADVLLSPDQKILVRDWRAKALTGEEQAVIPVSRLVDGDYIRRETVMGQQVVSIQFDQPTIFYAANLEIVG